ncbi:MAG TPA: hypothetical protein DCS55_17525 [Acidimicrobiaceae bacterium]|nr:hypothetical protein [Acidimicrobiaceae bacterium]
MITTGSKFFYGVAALLAFAAVVYGYASGGGGVGPISFGYKGGVGEHLGYGILLAGAVSALFAGFCVTAFRDADPEPTAALLGADTVPAATTTGSSFWPVVGAFGVVLTVVGVVLNNVFFVAGLIALGAVAIEWTMQAWADRATGDPAVNREIRNRIMFPIEVPLAGILAIAIVIVGYSRVFLAVSKLGAVWIALAIAATIFVIGTILSLRPRIRTDLVAGVLAAAAVVTIGLGIFGAVAGEREFHDLSEEHAEEGGAEAGASDESTDEGASEESN